MTLKENKGQAIFEFILFIPFMMFLYTVSYNLFNAINGSINQQKIVRGYFFARVKNNSYAPNRVQIDSIIATGPQSIGMLANGWRENRFSGGSTEPISSCYKISNLYLPNPEEKCDESVEKDVPTTFLRPQTVFGMCTAWYQIEDGNVSVSPHSAKQVCSLGELLR